ncbi:MAG TPA: hypothetical protein VK742_07105 [Candidatus Sulfotelmatobacter sp.]|jgi:hypothetical protein|nr:hypothetical protein [Candidatus Sulfotelmatobacter sp.]
MKLRGKILIGLGIFLLFVALSAWFTGHHQPASEVEAYKKFLREQGEKLDLSEVIPPSVPAASNSMDAVQSAFAMFGSGAENVPNAMKMVAPGKALVGWMQPDARGYDFTNSWEDFSARVALDRPALELLQQVLEKPHLDFQLDYKKGVSLLLPHLMSLKEAAQKLTSAAVLDLHNGDNGDAVTNILTLLALVEKDANDNLLICHLVRTAMVSIDIASTWEVLQATNATGAQLAAVQRGWEQLDFLGDATNTFVFERAWGLNEIRQLRATPSSIYGTSGFGPASPGGSSGVWSWPPDWEAITETARNAIGETMWRTSWSYSDELQTLKSEQVILEALRAMKTNADSCLKTNYDAMQSQLSRMGLTNVSPSRAFCRALKIPDFSELADYWSLSSTVNITLRIEAARRVVIVAIALKRYQLKHGAWPQTLGELAPELFPTVPIDPYDGKPLRYHPNPDGTYLLYCVGEDGVDDGGDPSVPASVTTAIFYWQNAKARDWVWPQPATEAEIRYFYEHPPK